MKIKAGRHTIEISHPDKVLIPGSGLTKGDVAGYYQKIAGWLLPGIRDRALTLERCPAGLDGHCFIQQEAKEFFPDYVRRVRLQRKDGGDLNHVRCSNVAGLVYLANIGVITMHRWLSRIDNPDFPDRLVFDLDPPDEDFTPVVHGAALLKEVLDEIGMVSFPMTTGSRGIHVVIPLARQANFNTVRAFAGDVASLLAVRHPDTLTTEQRRNKRKGRLFLDVQRNAYGQTGVAPYTLRAKEGAPVATPLDWLELFEEGITARSYTVSNIFRRLDRKMDPWKSMNRRARSLAVPQKKLTRLLEENS